MAIDGFVGVTAIDTSAGPVTVSAAAGLLIAPDAAVMFVEPAPTAVANPELLMVATPVAEEVHVAVAVRLAVLESV